MLPLIVLLALSLMSIRPAAGSPGPTYSVVPSSNTANPGDTFTVTMYISGAVNMYAWEFKMKWNNLLLQLVSVTEGPFLKSGGFMTFFAPPNIPQANLQGWMMVGCSRLGTVPGKTGSGDACYITFRAIEVYSCNLDLYDCNYMDPTLTRYWDVTAVDGSFDNTAIVGTMVNAELVKKSAWPEHHHFNIPKDEDFNTTHAYCAFNTLYGKVRNTGSLPVYLMVGFTDVPDILTPGDLFSSPTDTPILPGDELDLSADFGPLGLTEVGKYSISATAHYSYGGVYWYSGPPEEKSFSFAAVYP